MKIKPLKIKFESVNDFMSRTRKELKKAVKTGRRHIQKKDLMIWDSVEAYQQFMSDQKYAILSAIYKHKPQSVYKLAKILNRAQQNVARDCDLLEGHGFIIYGETSDARRTKVPRLAFNYNAIVIYLPSVTYKVALDIAA